VHVLYTHDDVDAISRHNNTKRDENNQLDDERQVFNKLSKKCCSTCRKIWLL